MQPGTPTSDLAYLFCSAQDCVDARRVLRAAVPKSTLGFTVGGMYDLLGRWDIAVRFRTLEGTTREKAADYLVRTLEESGQLQKKDTGTWSERRLIKISSVHRVVPNDVTQIDRPGHLGSPAMHEWLGCKQAFLVVDLDVADEERQELVASLHRQAFTSASDIIETFGVGEDAVVLDAFLSHPRALALDEVNQLFDQVLRRYSGVQKYTMFSYRAGDEDAIQSNRGDGGDEGLEVIGIA